MVKHLLTTTAVTLALASAGLAQQATQPAPVQTGEQPAQAQPAQAQQGPQEPVRVPAEQAPGTQGGQATGGQQPLQQQAQPEDQQQPPLVEAGERAPQQEAQPAPMEQEEPAEAVVVAPAEEDEQRATAAPAAGEAFITAHEVGQVRVDRVLGREVVNPQDEDVGDISDLVFDEEGRLVAAVIGVGGFLGLGQKNVAVSWDQIEWTPREDGSIELSIALTREQLEQAPEFKDLAAQRAEEEATAAQQRMMQQQPAAGAPGAMAPAPSPAAPPAQQ